LKKEARSAKYAAGFFVSKQRHLLKTCVICGFFGPSLALKAFFPDTTIELQ